MVSFLVEARDKCICEIIGYLLGLPQNIQTTSESFDVVCIQVFEKLSNRSVRPWGFVCFQFVNSVLDF